jgi:hypothetical protein
MAACLPQSTASAKAAILIVWRGKWPIAPPVRPAMFPSSQAVGSFLPGEAFGGFFRFKKFPLSFSALAVRIVDAPAGFSVVDNFFIFMFGAFWCLEKRPKKTKSGRSESKLKAD